MTQKENLMRCATSVLIVLIAPLVAWGQTPEQKKATVDYLRSLQTNIGGFTAFRPKPDQRVVPTVRATSSALRALKYFGGEPNDKNACAEYIKKAWDEKSGTFSDLGRGGPGEVAPTAVGLMAVVELKLPLDSYVEPASKYLSEHAKT